MTLLLRRFLLMLALLALGATACSSSSDGDTVDTSAVDTSSAVDDSAVEGNTAEEDTADDGTSDESAEQPTSIPVPENDSAADEAIAGLDGDTTTPDEALTESEPSATALGFIRARFAIDPTPEAVDCVLTESGNIENLDEALRSFPVSQGEVDDVQLTAMTLAMNGCVDPVGLGGWATLAIGPQGEVAETAPPCFAERFSDPERGDLTFSTFAAVTFQYRLDPDGVPDVTDALVECAPIYSLTEFFASQTEQLSGFVTSVDRECLTTTLENPEVSRDFWTAMISIGTPPADIMEPYIESCSTESAPEPAAPDDRAVAVPDDFVPWSGTGALAAVTPAARNGIYDTAPPMTISADGSYEAVIATNGGEIRIRLFADTAPITVNNFVSLARDGYYDGTIFHRVLDQFMAQGGDPTGTGTGGPGYQFQDEVDGGPALDRKGLLAMANAGPGTNGSQFFITFAPTEWLTGNHTVFGEVVEGIEIVDAIQLRDPGNPSNPAQVLDTVTIVES